MRSILKFIMLLIIIIVCTVSLFGLFALVMDVVESGEDSFLYKCYKEI